MSDIFNILFVLLIIIIKFYRLELRRQEMWKDILLNIMTNKVLCRKTYFVMYNLLTKKHYQRISMIQDKLEQLADVMPEDFGISKILSMDLAYRREIMKDERPKVRHPFVPYSVTIENIGRIRETESLICKLEFLFLLFTETLTSEIQEFW